MDDLTAKNGLMKKINTRYDAALTRSWNGRTFR